MHIVSSLLPFPPISWWAQIMQAESVTFDLGEHFVKMSYRNKYRIAGANNPVQLSVPLISGRDQRTPMKEVLIFNDNFWQVQHWRTLISVYRRSPFFEYYEHGLQDIFEAHFENLLDFNRVTTLWAATQLGINIQSIDSESFITEIPKNTLDIRAIRPNKSLITPTEFPAYYQVFAERTGFLPDLSILDLLCSEGPAATLWIKDNLLK